MKFYQGKRTAMNVDKFKPLTVYTIYIASTPAKVWEALTSAEFSAYQTFAGVEAM